MLLSTAAEAACRQTPADAAALADCEAAAAAGDPAALRPLFDALHYGRGVPADSARADAVLGRAAAAGQAWARLVTAARQEDSDPAAAAALYTELAAAGNCRAQLRLAQGHDRGGWVEKNRAQALFWASLAAASGRDPARVEGHPLFDGRHRIRDCAAEAFFTRDDLARLLPDDLRTRVGEAVAAWVPGQVPARLAPPEAPPALGVAPARARRPLPPWTPAGGMKAGAMKVGAMKAGPRGAALAAEAVFAADRPALWVVQAAADDEQLKAGKGRTGSAVAVDAATLLTNCHVIAEAAVIRVRQGGTTAEARPLAGDEGSDRCLLRVEGVKLAAVRGIRAYGDLKVGETVYTIGAPRGLEATLGQGLVSGLRTAKGMRYVQTTAPIAPGSSGGGLFDAAGNLVGITTFLLRDSQGLNFAIAAEEFFR